MIRDIVRITPLLLLATSLIMVVGCNGEEGVVGPEESTIQVATWGFSGIIYQSDEDNLVLIENLLLALGGDKPDLRILYTDDCDPRTDPNFCRLTNDFSLLQPFFDMIDGIGTVDFQLPWDVDPTAYDVVIAYFCSPLSSEAGVNFLTLFIQNGGHVLIAADNFCISGSLTTAAWANLTTEDLGLTFTDLDPFIDTPLAIPEEERVGLLLGVSTLSIRRTAPQVIAHSFDPVVTSDQGVLCAVLPAQN